MIIIINRYCFSVLSRAMRPTTKISSSFLCTILFYTLNHSFFTQQINPFRYILVYIYIYIYIITHRNYPIVKRTKNTFLYLTSYTRQTHTPFPPCHLILIHFNYTLVNQLINHTMLEHHQSMPPVHTFSTIPNMVLNCSDWKLLVTSTREL